MNLKVFSILNDPVIPWEAERTTVKTPVCSLLWGPEGAAGGGGKGSSAGMQEFSIPVLVPAQDAPVPVPVTHLQPASGTVIQVMFSTKCLFFL